MYVVTVEFIVAQAHVAAFLTEMLANARTSRASEPGCRQFDVSHAPGEPQRIFLYEVYDDRAAFEAHGKSAHYARFAATTSTWVEKKTVQTYERIDPA